MNLKIDNTIITDKITNLNFDQLKLEQQIIVLEEKTDYKDIQSYFLFSKPFENLFCFNKTECNLALETYNDITEMESDVKDDYCHLLKIGNNMIEIIFDGYDTESMYDFNEECNNYESIKDRYKLMTEVGLRSSDSVTYSTRNDVIDIEYISLIDLKHCYLAIEICNTLNPKRYYWNKNINIIILNKELDKYIDITIDSGIGPLIKALTNVYESREYSIERCLDFLNIYNYSMKSLISDNKKIDLIKKCFTSVYCLNEEDITKYFEPVLIDEKNKLKAYFSRFFTVCSPDPYVEYDIHNLDLDDLKKFKRKASSVIESLTHEARIDIYSGKCIDKDWRERYKDYEYLLIKRKNNFESFNNSEPIGPNESVEFYELLDDIYVHAEYFNQREIKKEINDRINICKTLTQY